MITLLKTLKNCQFLLNICKRYAESIDSTYYHGEYLNYCEIISDVETFIRLGDLATAWEHLTRSSLFKDSGCTLPNPERAIIPTNIHFTLEAMRTMYK